jgi:hypothetical protein
MVAGTIAPTATSAQTSAPAQKVSADDLARRAIERREIERRAVEAVIWGMPAVNYDLMYQEMLEVGGKPNQIAYGKNILSILSGAYVGGA